MKNCKKFYEAQIASRLKEIIQPSLTHSPNFVLLDYFRVF